MKVIKHTTKSTGLRRRYFKTQDTLTGESIHVAVEQTPDSDDVHIQVSRPGASDFAAIWLCPADALAIAREILRQVELGLKGAK